MKDDKSMPRLLVFLHLIVKQRALQAELQDALKTLAVTAVGRVADFQRGLEGAADAVLTLAPVLAANHLTPRLLGYQNGKADESYSLVAPERAPDPAHVRGVGALDLLGRDGTTAFVNSMTGGRPKVERVTKLEDLLPLLQMSRVDAVMLPSRLLAELQATTQMKLLARELPTRVGLPAVAVLNSQGNDALAAVAKLPLSITRPFGIDEWR
ncbi:MAG: hypothetical protein QM778_27995 [Myxococcales bacterium]